MKKMATAVATYMGVDRCIVIYPADGKTATDWVGLSADQVVRTLYACAESVLANHVPVAKPNAPEGPKRG